LPPREILPKARYAAVRALELDPTIAEAQALLADIQYEFDWNFPAAEQGFRKAIALNPSYAKAHQWYSNFLSVSKRFDESFVEIARARQLDPLNSMIDTDAGLASYWAGQYDRAQRLAFEQLLDNVGCAFVSADVVHGGDVGMVENARRACLLLEAA